MLACREVSWGGYLSLWITEFDYNFVELSALDNSGIIDVRTRMGL